MPVNSSGSVTGIWLGNSRYKIILQNSLGVQQWASDGVSGNNLFTQTTISLSESTPPSCNIGSDILWGDSAEHRFRMCNNNGAPDDVVGAGTVDILSNKTLISPNLTTPAIVSGSYSGTEMHNGTELFSNLNGIQFADQAAGADASCKIQAAINALPSSGGSVFGQNLPNEASGGSCTIDPGTKTITIYLGPHTYFVSQILLRPSLHIYGMGSGGFSQQSILQSCASCTTTDVFVLGGSTASSGVVLDGFRLYGASGSLGSTQQAAFNLIAQVNGGGLWNSEIRDLNILGFCGANAGADGIIRLDGSLGGTPPGINQFVTFRHIEAYRPTGCGPVVQIYGFNGQIAFRDSHLDSNSGVTDGTDIRIGDVSASLFPFNIIFDNVTVQGGDTLFSVSGCNECTINQGHYEGAAHGMLLQGGAAKSNLQWTNSQFNNNVGTGGGGYLINVTAPTTNASVVFTGNNFGSPTAAFTGNVGGISAHDNTGGTLLDATFQWNALNAFPSLTVTTGIVGNGSGAKHLRGTAGCATAASAGAVCTTTITWTSAFLDANYTAVCTGDAITSGIPLNGGLTAKVAASVTFRTVAGTAVAAQYTNIDCIAMHDAVAGP